MLLHDPPPASATRLVSLETAARKVDGGIRARRGAMVHKRMQIYLWLLTGDMLSIVGGFALTTLVWPIEPVAANLLPLLFVTTGVHLALACQSGAYGIDTLVRWRVGLLRAASGACLPSVATGSATWLWSIGPPGLWLYFGCAAACAAALMALHRGQVQRATTRHMPTGPLDVVILTDRPERFEPIRRVLDVRQFAPAMQLNCPISLDRLGHAVGDADRVILAVDDRERDQWIDVLGGLGADVHIVLPQMAGYRAAWLDRHDGQITACVVRGGLSIKDRSLKRLLDLTLVFWLLPLLALVLLAVTILIKLDDGGPILFVQKRIGRGNKLFNLYKFRTMAVAQLDEAGGMSTSRQDARVTRIGAFLRATSIDELPQLINVLAGSMSIVGPRPHAIGSRAEDQLFWDIDRRYWLRHAAKPGLTGLAQIRGQRGSTETQQALVARIHSDLEYLTGWSLLRDVQILLATVRVISHPNAY